MILFMFVCGVGVCVCMLLIHGPSYTCVHGQVDVRGWAHFPLYVLRQDVSLCPKLISLASLASHLTPGIPVPASWALDHRWAAMFTWPFTWVVGIWTPAPISLGWKALSFSEPSPQPEFCSSFHCQNRCHVCNISWTCYTWELHVLPAEDRKVTVTVPCEK